MPTTTGSPAPSGFGARRPDGTSVPAAPTMRRLPPREAERCGGETAAPVRRHRQFPLRDLRETQNTLQDRSRISRIGRYARIAHPAAMRTDHPQTLCSVRDIAPHNLNHISIPMKTLQKLVMRIAAFAPVGLEGPFGKRAGLWSPDRRAVRQAGTLDCERAGPAAPCGRRGAPAHPCRRSAREHPDSRGRWGAGPRVVGGRLPCPTLVPVPETPATGGGWCIVNASRMPRANVREWPGQPVHFPNGRTGACRRSSLRRVREGAEEL